MHTPVPMLREQRVSTARVTLVALGLVPAGAIEGALAGAVGALFGAILLPLAGFTVLRRAPLGRVLPETILVLSAWWRGRRPSAIR